MRLTRHVYLVGSGTLGGFDISQELDCNVYLVDGGSAMALIDAGAGLGVDDIIANMKEDGLDPQKLRYLVLTHKHADHAGGAAAWKRALGVDVLMAEEAAAILESGDEEGISLPIAKAGGIYPPDYRFEPCPVARRLRDGDTIQVGDLQLEVIATPGHCDGHLSFWMEAEGQAHLFSGDAILPGGAVVYQNIYDCSFQKHVQSIKKLASRRVDRFFPGHGPFALKRGKRHLEAAMDVLSKGGAPRPWQGA